MLADFLVRANGAGKLKTREWYYKRLDIYCNQKKPSLLLRFITQMHKVILLPIHGPEFDAVEEPVHVIRDFLKRNNKDAWLPEEISENTGIDITTAYHLCQLLRAKYVESAAKGKYFPIQSIERLGQTFFKWAPRSKSPRKGRK